MNDVYLMSNFDPKLIEFIGVFGILLLCASLFYNIVSTYYYYQEEYKRSELFKFFSRWTYRPAIILLALWGIFLIVNQINGWIEIFKYY